MKINSTSRSAFSVARVVLGFALCLAGVLLALAVYSAPYYNTGGDGNTTNGFDALHKNTIGVGNAIAAIQSSSTWQFVSSMSMRRTHVATVSAVDGVYALGGDTDRYVCSWGCGVTASVERYSFGTGSWSTVAPMNKARDYFAAATGSDGRVYAIGGWTPDEGVTNTAEVYSPDTNSWAFIAAIPVRVAMEAATTGQDGQIYVLGGGPVMNQPTRTVLIYDPALNAWSYGPPMLEPLNLLGAATGTDGRIYAIASNPEVYDPVSGAWSFIAPLPTARSYLAGAADRDGRIYALGGCCAPGALQEVDIYSPATNTWAVGPSMLLQRSTPGVAFGKDGRLYAVGGSDDTFNLRSAEVLDVGCLPPPAGLVSWWSGDRTADDMQGINPGELVGGVSYKRGMVGPGFLFHGGLNDYVQVGDTPTLKMTTAMTLECWIYPTRDQEGIIANREGEYEVWFDVGGDVLSAFAPDWVAIGSGDFVAPLGTWTHVAITYDNGLVTTYGNGDQVHQSQGSPGPIGDVLPTLNDFRIGNRQQFPEPFTGIIDELKVYNRALSSSEVAAIYAAGSGGNCKPEIFVASIDPSYEVVRHGFLISTSIVIQDENGVAIEDASAQIKTILPSGSVLDFPVTTDATGQATVSFGTEDSGLYKFQVRRVTYPTREYNPSLNIETTDTLLIP